MENVIFTLSDGFKDGDNTHFEVEMRESTGGDWIDASREAEIPAFVDNTWRMVPSDLVMGLQSMRRQIVRVGDYVGPLTLKELARFSRADLNLIQQHAERIDDLAIEVALMGRTETAGADVKEHNDKALPAT